jgi:hypothetical protein
MVTMEVMQFRKVANWSAQNRTAPPAGINRKRRRRDHQFRRAGYKTDRKSQVDFCILQCINSCQAKIGVANGSHGFDYIGLPDN